jgi:hypothetical protein
MLKLPFNQLPFNPVERARKEIIMHNSGGKYFVILATTVG